MKAFKTSNPNIKVEIKEILEDNYGDAINYNNPYIMI